jgi:hypothetical protein
MTDDAAGTKARSVRASLFSAHAFAPRQSTAPAEGQLADRHQLRRLARTVRAENTPGITRAHLTGQTADVRRVAVFGGRGSRP